MVGTCIGSVMTGMTEFDLVWYPRAARLEPGFSAESWIILFTDPPRPYTLPVSLPDLPGDPP